MGPSSSSPASGFLFFPSDHVPKHKADTWGHLTERAVFFPINLPSNSFLSTAPMNKGKKNGKDLAIASTPSPLGSGGTQGPQAETASLLSVDVYLPAFLLAIDVCLPAFLLAIDVYGFFLRSSQLLLGLFSPPHRPHPQAAPLNISFQPLVLP